MIHGHFYKLKKTPMFSDKKPYIVTLIPLRSNSRSRVPLFISAVRPLRKEVRVVGGFYFNLAAQL